jgi:hypothetical protein
VKWTHKPAGGRGVGTLIKKSKKYASKNIRYNIFVVGSKL